MQSHLRTNQWDDETDESVSKHVLCRRLRRLRCPMGTAAWLCILGMFNGLQHDERIYFVHNEIVVQGIWG